MKNVFSYFIPAVALTLLSCGAGSGDDVAFEKVSADKTVSLTADADAPQCIVHLQMDAAKADGNAERAKAINEAVAVQMLGIEGATLQQAVDSFANKYTADYVANMAPLYREDRGDELKHPWYEYRYSIDTETREGRDGVVVYLVTLDYYEGGAHGINQLLPLNFDARTGSQLHLSDVFVPGYESRLTDILLDALQESTSTKSIEELHDQGYLYSMDMFASENFVLDKDHITFKYNPYEIAPYAVGIVELEVNYDDLKDILK